MKRLGLVYAFVAFLISLGIGNACRRGGEGADEGHRASKMGRKKMGSSGGYDGLYVETRPYMGTIFRIVVALDPRAPDHKALRERAAKAVGTAFRAVADIESRMSDHIEGSEVFRLNEASGKALAKSAKSTPALPVSPDTMAVLQEAMQASRLTAGAFDVSYAALKGPWAMKGDGPHRVPKREEITKALAFVGYKGIHLDPQSGTVRLRPGMRLDLGGVAKGYALDIASKVLKDSGFPNHIVYGGGDLSISGRRPDRRWRIGIQDPGKQGEYFAVLSVTDMAVVTSGDYERFMEKNGRRYAHIIDPRTGRPAHGLHSVTVVADRAVYADAMATGLFVMGLAKGKALVERLPGTEALFVTDRGKVILTSGLQGKLDILHPPTLSGATAADAQPKKTARRLSPVVTRRGGGKGRPPAGKGRPPATRRPSGRAPMPPVSRLGPARPR